MLDNTNRERHSPDLEKDEVNHLENATSRTPPSEMEKGQRLTPVASRGPEVHEKVNAQFRYFGVPS